MCDDNTRGSSLLYRVTQYPKSNNINLCNAAFHTTPPVYDSVLPNPVLVSVPNPEATTDTIRTLQQRSGGIRTLPPENESPPVIIVFTDTLIQSNQRQHENPHYHTLEFSVHFPFPSFPISLFRGAHTQTMLERRLSL